MRILVLNWQDRENPQAGGAEIHLHETFGRLARRPGWEVTAVTSGWPGAAPRAELDGIRVLRTGGRHTYPLRVAGAVRRLVAAGASFDVVVEDLNKVPVLAPSWAPAPVLLLVHHLFGATAFQEASFPVAAATWLLERPIPRFYRGLPVVAVSDSTRHDLIRRGLSGDRIRVIPNGVDLDHFTPGPEAGDPVGGARFPEPTLLYLGRLKRYKRVDLLLEALARVRAGGLPARAVVAGKGDHGPSLEARARKLGLGPDAVTFAGFVSEPEKLRLLRGAWVHGFTSPREGWGIANLEAAACGTPTLASDAPGLRDSVRHGETGYLVPHGDVEALARRLGELLSRREEVEALGRGARRFAEGFSWDGAAEQMARALADAAGKGTLALGDSPR
jgi:glycosyltransferase involved in cell wall biosynthesis